jgi:hypothetical protein
MQRVHLGTATIYSGGHPASHIRRHLAARATKPNPRHDFASIKPPGRKPGDTAAKMTTATGGSARMPERMGGIKSGFPLTDVPGKLPCCLLLANKLLWNQKLTLH